MCYGLMSIQILNLLLESAFMAKKTKGMVQGIYLPVPLMEWVKREAEKDRRSVSNFLAILIEKAKHTKEKNQS